MRGSVRSGFQKYLGCLVEKHRGVKDISIPVSERNLEHEDTVTISRKAAEEEARRCMNCGCYSVNASDISPALLLLDAEIVTTKKTVGAAEFFTEHLDTKDQLEPGEIVKEIVIHPDPDAVTHYEKFRLRKSIDFAIVSLASSYKPGGKDIRLVLGGVAPVPVELKNVEAYLAGKELTDEVIEKASEMSVDGALPIRNNEFKLQEVRIMVKRFLESVR